MVNEVYRTGSAYMLVPDAAYAVPPTDAEYYREVDRRQAAYVEAVINWDRSYYLDGNLYEGRSISSSAAAILPQPGTFIDGALDGTFRDNAVSFDERG
ncbi:hypothetical protein KQI63_13765 [bacterium]|nr:hypothetical protein [bacterium]